DGKSVIQAVPGQYLGVDLNIPGHGQTRRNYSITSKPGHDGYTISVRHVPNGIVSTWLNSADSVGHEVRLSPPAGEFVLPEKIETPVAFICAGIGITPMIGMIESLAEKSDAIPVSVIQIAHSAEAAPFSSKLRELTDASGNISLYTRLTSVDGRPDADWIASHLPKNAACYLCGPTGFMREMVQSLPKAGIPAERLRYETFGPDTGVTD
ncbi:dihydropteridine reductase, partial [Gluconobacter japonicus]